ncbi:MAG: GT4 family glycosyltransferase PelF [Pedobacter sp.]|nr:GT4 family glycosyltransferase PelF [Pedobacter sp.]
MIIRQGKSADVGLLLEGTFPYVSGGVSSWVNQIIRGFPELTFALCFIGSRKEDYGDMRFQLPDNVVHLEVHYLHGGNDTPPVMPRRTNAAINEQVRALHEHFRQREGNKACPHQENAAMQALLKAFRDGQYTEEDFLYSRGAWDYITQQYRERCTDPSFVDYFWTVRIMHRPLWQLMKVAENFIPVRCYHTISTGYAGYLGALLKQRRGRPLLLSEHGIYTKERKIDLFQAEWIRDNRGVLEKDSSEVAYFRNLWVRFFEALGRECYQHSHNIIALYETNRLRQITDGAPPERTQNIPNGINLPHLEKVREKRAPGVPLTICLIGRVVPIKDVKTYIRAMRTLVNRLPDVQAWIAGPEDEDPEYAKDCHNLVAGLGLSDNVKFLGFQKIDELLPKVGVMVLSSISEALPLVILEGYAAGVPCVSTDVGSCRQLIEGLGEEDRALGSSGEVVGIADPEALALAILKLLDNEERWHAAQAAGIARVGRYYTQEMMFAKYRAVYEDALSQPDGLTPDAGGAR